MRYAATAYLWQLHSNENRPFQGPRKCPMAGCKDAKMRGCFRWATQRRQLRRQAGKSQGVINTNRAPATATLCHFPPAVARVAKPRTGYDSGLGFGFPFPVPVQCVAAIMQMPGSQVDRLLIAICI